MNGLALFAETPRAGQQGHRWLWADNPEIDNDEFLQSRLAAFFEAAKRENIVFGENFIALGCEVPERLKMPSACNGLEVMVLAGIDVTNTPRDLLAEVLNLLVRRFPLLSQLVEEKTDWTLGRQTPIISRCPEMASWLAELEKYALPTTGWRRGPRLIPWGVGPNEPIETPTNPGLRLPLWLLSCLLLFCFLGGGLSGVTYSDYVKDWFPGGSPPQGGGPQGPEGGPKPESGAPSPPINDGGGEAKIDQRIESEIGRDNLLPLIELLEKAPGDKKLSYSSLQKILNKLDRSIGTENYPLEEQIDKLVHVLQNRSDFFPEDSNELKASFEDSKRKLAEKRAARLSEDKRGYRDVLDAIDRKRKEAAARHYLTRNPNGMMRSEVQCWLDWAHRPIRIQLRDIQPLPGSRSTDFDIGKIYFEFAGKRQDLQLKRDQIPVDLDLLYLEITGKDFPVTLKVSFEIKNSPDTQSSRKKYSGELKIDSANSLDPIEVSLDLIGVIPRLNRENIVLAFANMELEPELAPDWTPKPR